MIRVQAAIVVLALALAPSALAAGVPHGWHAQPWWLAEATCIHDREGAWPDNTGNSYFGGAQFLSSTWYSVHGPYEAAFDHPGDPRYPFAASPREQLYRMWLVYRRDGNWSEWGTAGMCGLR